ncbi:Aim6 protein [Saccharomycopsis crataegensis]|uniref:Altered inheritance of mitochondria protein 6 n=1 Tax=Saccharomycopsis crataegensis TaxID=43959 RepID=A0AAV5QLL8_9ASCO|nr:Aim6 protein [Saccharomycopsis crataegensis]
MEKTIRLTVDFHNPSHLAMFVLSVGALVVPLTMLCYVGLQAVLGQAYNTFDQNPQFPVDQEHFSQSSNNAYSSEIYSVGHHQVLSNHRKVYNQFAASLFQNLHEGICNPDNSTASQLTRDKNVIPVHSHNDYWRTLPVFDAFSNGMNSIEADIWLKNDPTNDGAMTLLVGHNEPYLQPQHSVENLYLKMLNNLLDEVNCVGEIPSSDFRKNGFFYNDPHTTTYLYIDIKTESTETYKVFIRTVVENTTLIKNGYLTYFDFSKKELVWGPLTLVITGNVPTEFIFKEEIDDPFNLNKRISFVDAQLINLDNIKSNNDSISVIGSGSLNEIVGTTGIKSFGGLNEEELSTMKKVVEEAHNLNIKVRIWDTPNWPVQIRDMVWKQLLELNVDYLNVDDLSDARKF